MKQKDKTRTHSFYKKIEEQQKNILASIRYARRIQDAILVNRSTLTSIFDDFSIVYEPKDIVSGDFYYARKKENEKLLFVGDCTGHGVPGGFMSVLCNDILIRALKRNTSPALILERVSDLLEKKLNSDQNQEIYDGMDCSLATINYNTHTVKFAGARNHGVLIKRNGSIELLKASKRSIGKCSPHVKKVPFSEFKTTFENGDLLYLYTDGYLDQFNIEGAKLGRTTFLKKLAKMQDYTIKEQQTILNMLFQNQKKGTFQIDDVLVLGVRL